MSASSYILEVKNLQVQKGGILVLEIPDLAIAQGEILSLIGPNGAGKTTLLQALSCLIKLSQGEIYFKGGKISANHSAFEYRRRLAMVFQDPLLFDTTVFENVASGLKIRGIPKKETKEFVNENLNRFGIAHLLHRSARKISGGEAQRVALARALATQPEILLLDEPFASLDPPTREALLEDLESVLRQTKTTALLATHDRMEALRLSDRIGVMNNGRILQVGPPGEVMNQPLNEFVASFVGIETILTGRASKKERGSFLVSIMGREIEAVGQVEPGETVVLCIRPENVTLSPFFSQGATSARNVFAGRITKIIPLGLFYKVQLNCGFPLVAFVTGHSLENLDLQEGQEVVASFKATSIHVVRKRQVSF
ncbi:MAG: ABC transporter ATP-binding protein [Thermodesulfobacteriota bacterium]|nr:ABC transporter ATP-binding protein [Thermodesulfobacteriota bacterium]